MTFKIIEESPAILSEYEKISIAFSVKSRFRVELIKNGLGGIKFVEEAVAPFIKDYDANENERPSRWSKRFDVSNWGILSAFEGEKRVGGAAIAWNTPGVNMLENHKDTACLWDLRVHPDYRGKGVGHRLFAAAIEWSKARACRRFIVETQDINVPACRFYVAQGCELGVVNRSAYPETMNEIQLIWQKDISD